MLTEWTSSSGVVYDQTSIAEGVAGVLGGDLGVTFSGRSAAHGFASVAGTTFYTPSANVTTSPTTCTRRYQFTIALGLFTQGKLLPTKFMASQLAVELSLAKETECIIANAQANAATVLMTLNPTYSLTNINMIPEILEFDASYDNMFLKGLQEGGVPIKFSSWHTYQFTHPGANTANILIQERSRSVKSIFTIIRRQQTSFNNDSGALFSNCAATNQMESYQYRIGGRYFPASPVQVSNGSGLDIGSAEAFLELQKALHTVGDSRLSTNISDSNWAPRYIAVTGAVAGVTPTTTQEADGAALITQLASSANAVTGSVVSSIISSAGVPTVNLPSACFCMATSLETTSGMEISGLNAEEQSDISLNIKWTGTSPGAGEFLIETYVFYDAMIVLRENNVFSLITPGSRIDSISSFLKSMFSNKIWITWKLKLILHMRLYLIVLYHHRIIQ